jgi:lipopolysaccharide transport system permease protein
MKPQMAAAPASSAADLPVRVYTPESAMRHPAELLRAMFSDLWASRELAWRLFVRDTSARYRQSLLGYFWAFLPPVISTFTFVFLNRSGVLRGGDPRIPYPAFVIVGTLLWQLFADAVTTPIRAVTTAKPILAKINFPREAILLAGVYEVLFNFLIRLVLVVPVFAYCRVLPPPAAAFGLVGVLGILCLGLAIGVVLTPIGVLYSDIGQGLNALLSFWMLFSAVVYLPPATGALAVLGKVNPISPLIVVSREWLTLGVATQIEPALIVAAIAVPTLFAGWGLYRLAMPILIERMGG